MYTSTRTAKDFQKPLLQVMGNLTGMKAGVSVAAEDIYSPVMALMGIPDINVMGTEASTGSPLVQRNIQWACKNYRNSGHMELSGRGRWALTATGVHEAASLPVSVPMPKPAQAATVDESDPEVMDLIPEPEIPTPAVRPARSPHLDDPYILGLILAQTPCLGHFTPHKGAECATCDLVPECRNAQYSRYTTLATKFAAAEAKAKAEAEAKAKASQDPLFPPTVSAAPTPKVTSSGKTKIDWTIAERISAFEETICEHCGKTLHKGTKIVWLEDTKQGLTKMYHMDCVE